MNLRSFGRAWDDLLKTRKKVFEKTCYKGKTGFEIVEESLAEIDKLYPEKYWSKVVEFEDAEKDISQLFECRNPLYQQIHSDF